MANSTYSSDLSDFPADVVVVHGALFHLDFLLIDGESTQFCRTDTTHHSISQTTIHKNI